MQTIKTKATCLVVTTDAITGLAEVAVKVAGTFDGFDPEVSSGRFLRGITVFTDVGVAGDRAYGFRVEDVDGVIPVPARAAFANYPVIECLYDEAVVETASHFLGAWVKPGQMTVIETPSGVLSNFIPSGLWIKGNVKSVGATVFRANLCVGKRA